MPPAHQWSVEPTVREMLNILEQFLLDQAEPVLTQARDTSAQTLSKVSSTLDLILAALGRKHPDYRLLETIYEQLLDLRDRLYSLSRDRVHARFGEIAALLAAPPAELKQDLR
ncbi:hypothetical protein CA223_05560 [Sphingomonas koreensis]|uniref:Uncharacterized protein n=1 Tax=Sphingomonas koreensis TaxID=93064 RepID=A0A1L6JC17_9SPHN|nr:hypothetical protein BRX40_13915 [Sphingomonas koreensis]RSU24499.1 hypothetical protein CA224_01925 [Sphingomonas koreensis]RSU25144.1 hypothetical protein CA222_13515 [Sphingomonas koreensis]RSU30181.1 hypothetical protein CA225_05835 [Sphingomonas koreensis]RSU37382.1 hypothetical protein BRX39_05690 [Sphingomonas koreensis]